jgi:hypothetical protein
MYTEVKTRLFNYSKVQPFMVALVAIVSLLLLVTHAVGRLPIYIAFAIGAALLLPLVDSLRYFCWVPIYILRFLLLGLPGLLVGGIVLFGQIPVLFTVSAMQYQTSPIAIQILFLSILALCSSYFGWLFANPTEWRVTAKPRSLSGGEFAGRYWSYFFIAVVCGTFAAKALGGLLWDRSFSYVGMQPYMGIGVFSVFASFSVIAMYSLMLTTRNTGKVYWWGLGFVAAYVLVYCLLLRGARLDVLGTLVALFFLTVLHRGKQVDPWQLGGILAVAVAIVLVWGVLRHDSIGRGATLESFRGAFSLVLVQADGSAYLHLPNVADIVAVLFQVVGLVDDGHLALQHGQSYLNYLPQTLPTFLYPDRPLGFSINNINGQVMTGSLFELAEAYANFGVWGCLIVPGLLTYLGAIANREAIKRGTFMSYLWYGIALAIVIRGTWYQNFSFYKAPVSWLVVEAGILLLVVLTSVIKRNKEGKVFRNGA